MTVVSPARRRRMRSATLAVMVVLLAAVGGATYGTHKIVSDQERSLVKQRAEELNFVLTSLIQSSTARLSNVAAVARISPDPVAAFTSQVRIDGLQGARSLALLKSAGPGFTVVAAAGPDLHAGQPAPPFAVAAAGRALSGGTFFTTPVVKEDAGYEVGIALGPPQAPVGYVVYQESPVQRTPSPSSSSGPFSELAVALYDGPRADPEQLVLANAPLSDFGSGTISNHVKIGGSDFLVVTNARVPLVGGVSRSAEWFVLGLGLVLATLVTALFWFNQRRRDYALQLVDERTSALNESLEALRATQDQLVERERLAAIGQLASTVGHELRNPLAVISNALYLVRRVTGPTEDDRVRQHLDTAEREVAAATLIVSDLLEFSRARQPMLSDVDVGDLVDEALAVAPHPEAVRVVWQRPDPALAARADRDQLRQVVLNLITNAYDAMPDGGVLTVDAHSDGNGRVVVAVTDDGQGMDGATQAHILEPFFTTKARGTGLGLAVSARIMTALEGSIDVTSKPGAGTTFRLALPAARREAPDPAVVTT